MKIINITLRILFFIFRFSNGVDKIHSWLLGLPIDRLQWKVRKISNRQCPKTWNCDPHSHRFCRSWLGTWTTNSQIWNKTRCTQLASDWPNCFAASRTFFGWWLHKRNQDRCSLPFFLPTLFPSRMRECSSFRVCPSAPVSWPQRSEDVCPRRSGD
mgnify:CR=1 FL=1